jgi:hypothetical protein
MGFLEAHNMRSASAPNVEMFPAVSGAFLEMDGDDLSGVGEAVLRERQW